MSEQFPNPEDQRITELGNQLPHILSELESQEQQAQEARHVLERALGDNFNLLLDLSTITPENAQARLEQINALLQVIEKNEHDNPASNIFTSSRSLVFRAINDPVKVVEELKTLTQAQPEKLTDEQGGMLEKAESLVGGIKQTLDFSDYRTKLEAVRNTIANTLHNPSNPARPEGQVDSSVLPGILETLQQVHEYAESLQRSTLDQLGNYQAVLDRSTISDSNKEDRLRQVESLLTVLNGVDNNPQNGSHFGSLYKANMLNMASEASRRVQEIDEHRDALGSEDQEKLTQIADLLGSIREKVDFSDLQKQVEETVAYIQSMGQTEAKPETPMLHHREQFEKLEKIKERVEKDILKRAKDIQDAFISGLGGAQYVEDNLNRATLSKDTREDRLKDLEALVHVAKSAKELPEISKVLQDIEELRLELQGIQVREDPQAPNPQDENKRLQQLRDLKASLEKNLQEAQKEASFPHELTGKLAKERDFVNLFNEKSEKLTQTLGEIKKNLSKVGKSIADKAVNAERIVERVGKEKDLFREEDPEDLTPKAKEEWLKDLKDLLAKLEENDKDDATTSRSKIEANLDNARRELKEINLKSAGLSAEQRRSLDDFCAELQREIDGLQTRLEEELAAAKIKVKGQYDYVDGMRAGLEERFATPFEKFKSELETLNQNLLGAETQAKGLLKKIEEDELFMRRYTKLAHSYDHTFREFDHNLKEANDLLTMLEPLTVIPNSRLERLSSLLDPAEETVKAYSNDPELFARRGKGKWTSDQINELQAILKSARGHSENAHQRRDEINEVTRHLTEIRDYLLQAKQQTEQGGAAPQRVRNPENDLLGTEEDVIISPDGRRVAANLENTLTEDLAALKAKAEGEDRYKLVQFITKQPVPRILVGLALSLSANAITAVSPQVQILRAAWGVLGGSNMAKGGFNAMVEKRALDKLKKISQAQLRVEAPHAIAKDAQGHGHHGHDEEHEEEHTEQHADERHEHEDQQHQSADSEWKIKRKVKQLQEQLVNEQDPEKVAAAVERYLVEGEGDLEARVQEVAELWGSFSYAASEKGTRISTDLAELEKERKAAEQSEEKEKGVLEEWGKVRSFVNGGPRLRRTLIGLGVPLVATGAAMLIGGPWALAGAAGVNLVMAKLKSNHQEKSQVTYKPGEPENDQGRDPYSSMVAVAKMLFKKIRRQPAGAPEAEQPSAMPVTIEKNPPLYIYSGLAAGLKLGMERAASLMPEQEEVFSRHINQESFNDHRNSLANKRRVYTLAGGAAVGVITAYLGYRQANEYRHTHTPPTQPEPQRPFQAEPQPGTQPSLTPQPDTSHLNNVPPAAGGTHPEINNQPSTGGSHPEINNQPSQEAAASSGSGQQPVETGSSPHYPAPKVEVKVEHPTLDLRDNVAQDHQEMNRITDQIRQQQPNLTDDQLAHAVGEKFFATHPTEYTPSQHEDIISEIKEGWAHRHEYTLDPKAVLHHEYAIEGQTNTPDSNLANEVMKGYIAQHKGETINPQDLEHAKEMMIQKWHDKGLFAADGSLNPNAHDHLTDAAHGGIDGIKDFQSALDQARQVGEVGVTGNEAVSMNFQEGAALSAVSAAGLLFRKNDSLPADSSEEGGDSGAGSETASPPGEGAGRETTTETGAASIEGVVARVRQELAAKMQKELATPIPGVTPQVLEKVNKNFAVYIEKQLQSAKPKEMQENLRLLAGAGGKRNWLSSFVDGFTGRGAVLKESGLADILDSNPNIAPAITERVEAVQKILNEKK